MQARGFPDENFHQPLVCDKQYKKTTQVRVELDNTVYRRVLIQAKME